jgi:hypothetical protein
VLTLRLRGRRLRLYRRTLAFSNFGRLPIRSWRFSLRFDRFLAGIGLELLLRPAEDHVGVEQRIACVEKSTQKP